MIPKYTNRLKKEEWEVRCVKIETARKIVVENHYAKGASNTATYLHGLFRVGSEECCGVAWWIPPTKTAAAATFHDWQKVLALSRLVVTPNTPKNACTFLLSRSAKMIPAERWPCLVTYADDWRGHKGTIYKACNWEYVGKTTPEATFVIDGRMVSRKAGPKTRTREEMLALGAVMVGRFAKSKYRTVRK